MAQPVSGKAPAKKHAPPPGRRARPASAQCRPRQRRFSRPALPSRGRLRAAAAPAGTSGYPSSPPESARHQRVHRLRAGDRRACADIAARCDARRSRLAVHALRHGAPLRRICAARRRTADLRCAGALKGWFKHGVCKQALWPKLDEPVPTGAAGLVGRRRAPTARRVLPGRFALRGRHAGRAERNRRAARERAAHAGWDDGFTRKGGKKAAPNGIWTIPYPRKTSPNDGHAFALVGYDEDGFIVQNSWGNGWGTHGLAILTYEDWIKHGYDCWVAQLGVVTRRHEAQAVG